MLLYPLRDAFCKDGSILVSSNRYQLDARTIMLRYKLAFFRLRRQHPRPFCNVRHLGKRTRPSIVRSFESVMSPVGFSDHSAIFAVRKLHRLKPPPPRIVETRNLKHFNRDAFVEDLNKVPWSLVNSFSDVEDSWDTFKQLFTEVADSHAPKIHVRVRGQRVPWLTREVKQLMKERDYFHKLALKTNNESHWSSFKRQRNVVTLKLRKEKQRYFRDQFQVTKEDPRGTWKNLKQLLGGSKSTGPVTCSANEVKNKCNIFNRYFVSCAENLRSTNRSNGQSFYKWLPQLEHSNHFKLRASFT